MREMGVSDESLGGILFISLFPRMEGLFFYNDRFHTFTRPADVASTKPARKRIAELNACCCRGDKRRRVAVAASILKSSATNPLPSSMRS